MTEDERIALEERIAFAEIARDNALAMRDEAQERLRVHRKNAGRMIGELRKILIDLLLEVRPERAKVAAEQMQAILDAGKETER